MIRLSLFGCAEKYTLQSTHCALEREKLLWTGGGTDGSKAQEEVLADLKRSLGKVENPFNHKKDNSSCTL